MGIPALPKTWVANEVLTATDLNGCLAAIRDHYNANAVETSGAQTIAGVKTFSDGPVLSAQTLTFTHATARVVPGATSIAFRNTANSADNVLIADAGAVTLRAGLTIAGALGGVTTLTASGAVSTGALSCTTLSPSGLVQLDHQGAYKRYSGGDAGATPSFNWNNGNVQRWRLTANATPVFSNPQAGACYVLELQQDTTGSRTVTWSGATIAWADGTAPTLTTTASRKDVVVLLCVDETGSGTYLGNVFGQNFNNTTA